MSCEPTRLPARGKALTLYNGSRPDQVITPASTELLTVGRPAVAMLHASPRALLGQDPSHRDNPGVVDVIAKIRDLVPGIRIWLGVGCDGWTRHAALNGERGFDEGVAWLMRAAELAERVGAEVIDWDQEDAGKDHPLVAARVATAVIQRTRSRFPRMLQAFTSYGHPVAVRVGPGRYHGGHRPFPFSAWLGPAGVDFNNDQGGYAAPREGMAARGALAFAFRTSDESWAEAERIGLARPGMPRVSYVQMHGVPAAQTATHTYARPRCCYWASPTRVDAEGRLGFLAVCELDRRGIDTPEKLEAFQREAGIAPDRVVGKLETIPALGVR